MLVRIGADQATAAPTPIRLSIFLRETVPLGTSMDGSCERMHPTFGGEAVSRPSIQVSSASTVGDRGEVVEAR